MSISKILIADDHPLIRNALRHSLFEADSSLRVIEAGSLGQVTELLERRTKIDLILLDLSMPGSQGLSGVVFVSGFRPEIPIVVVSTIENPRIISLCKHIGAVGYIPKSTPTPSLREAISAILDGVGWFPPRTDLVDLVDKEVLNQASRFSLLSPQEMRTLALICKGRLNKQISFDLCRSEATVKVYVSAILSKLGVRTRTQAVIALNRIARQLQPNEGYGQSTIVGV